ncbi:MAG: beta-ketoacyl synthase N-terminal-like domain-containing protein [Hyphomonadaceae bacterium]
MITPLAGNREATWERLLAGKSGANKLEHFKVDDLPCRIGCLVPRVDGLGGGAGDAHAFDPDKTMSAKDRRRIEDFILYAIAAADEAVEDSGWKPESDEEKNVTGVLIGSGIGGIEAISAIIKSSSTVMGRERYRRSSFRAR